MLDADGKHVKEPGGLGLGGAAVDSSAATMSGAEGKPVKELGGLEQDRGGAAMSSGV